MAHGLLAVLLALSQDVTTSGDEFVARAPGVATTVRVYDHNLIGPTVQMGRYGRTLRGRAFGAATEVSWDDQRVTGLSGGAPVNLTYRIEPDGALRLDGMYAGNLTHLEIGPLGIHGHIGPRDFQMESRRGVFVSSVPVFEIEIPAVLATRETGEMAATLPILLAGFAGPSTEPVVPQPRELPKIVARRRVPADPSVLFRVTPPDGWPQAPQPARFVGTGVRGQIGAMGAQSHATPPMSSPAAQSIHRVSDR